MTKSFPLGYTTSKTDAADQVPAFKSLVHMSHSQGINNKDTQSDYFSTTPQLIFDKFVSQEEKDEGIRGYYGLPEAKQVAQDLIVQMMSPEDPMIQSMQVEQYWFPRDIDGRLQLDGRNKAGFVDGYHIDIVLRDSFLADFVNEKKETIYKVNEADYDEIVIEISDDAEVAEHLRITNLVELISRISEINDVRVRQLSAHLPRNSLAINGKLHQMKNYLNSDGRSPTDSCKMMLESPITRLRDIALGHQHTYKLVQIEQLIEQTSSLPESVNIEGER